jgi:N-acetyl-1-D-myo-inositol-2-amino-2-deoxy-alpha-D-glucopyranoside deacetylase
MPEDNEKLSLMAVRAHPDDECFTVGGSLARYSTEGVNTVVVICTGGENGEIVDAELNTPENKERLAEIRFDELQKSCGILGVRHVEMLGYRDSGMAETPENEDSRSFNKADVGEATDKLIALIRRHRPQILLTDNEEGSYGHPDHIMCNRISVAAIPKAADGAYRPDLGLAHSVPKLYYTAFARFQIVGAWRKMRELGLEMPWRRDGQEADTEPTWGLPDEEIGALVDIRPYVDRKIASLHAHRTQVAPDMWMFQLPEDILKEFLGVEVFQRINTSVPTEGREEDLFAGIREGVPA